AYRTGDGKAASRSQATFCAKRNLLNAPLFGIKNPIWGSFLITQHAIHEITQINTNQGIDLYRRKRTDPYLARA
ncbi:MAG: hypothetical protein ACREBC_18575, partial [Pyrinomonadaceae bacterium]